MNLSYSRSLPSWLANGFRPLLLSAMMACLALAFVELVRLFVPAWNGVFVLVGCVLAVWEAFYSERVIRKRWLFFSDRARFRAIELGLFFLFLKAASFIGDPWPSVLAQVQRWPRDLFSFFDLETVLTFCLVLLAWYIATQTVADLEQLDDPHGPAPGESPLDSLTGRFFWGGAVLLILSGITRVGLAALLNLSRPSTPGLVLNVLVYFLLGLVLLGQARLARLRASWQASGVRVASELPGRWARYSLIFIGLAALLAFILPTNYTVGLLGILNGLFSLVGALVIVLFFFLLLPLNLLLWLLFSLLGRTPPPILRAPPQLPLPPPAAGSSLTALDLLRSVVFWIILLAMVIYVLRSYLRDHPEIAQTLSKLGPVRALRRLWDLLRGQVRGWAEAVNASLPRDLWQRLMRRSSAAQPFNFFRLGGASPREQILYYYLSLLRRAEQGGFPRRPAQTPDEYEPTLEAHVPEAQPEVDALTRAFVEARYSPHLVEPNQAKHARASWERVRAALRAVRDPRRKQP